MLKNTTETKSKGKLVISLDFELYWGVRDKLSLESYRANLLGVRQAIPALLKLFAEYDIHATWATVGFLFFESRAELLAGLPALQPAYTNPALSNYNHITGIGDNEQQDLFHFAPSMVKMIAAAPHQELATHTLSHYYCLEKGQTVDTFKADLEAALAVARRQDIALESLVFPRNQYNSQYVAASAEKGIKAYRGNPSNWLYQASDDEGQSLLRRGLRLLDSYVNLTGHHCYSLAEVGATSPCNIGASRFLRPYSRRLKILESLRLRRITGGLTLAAKTGSIYHLWWHPHNFGVNLEENLAFLRRILDHYKGLQKSYGMESLSMGELARNLTLIKA